MAAEGGAAGSYREGGAMRGIGREVEVVVERVKVSRELG